MLLQSIPSELVLHVFASCYSIRDVLNLSLTCRRLHQILGPSKRLSILLDVAEAEYGPVSEVTQLLSLNNVQSVHQPRQPFLSYTLLRDVVQVARVAQKWEMLYPLEKWKSNYTNRRGLTPDELHRLRRAVYRFWQYAEAFHSPLHPRTMRHHHTLVLERLGLLHNWSTDELAEIEDFRIVMRAVLQKALSHSDLNSYHYHQPMHSLQHHGPAPRDFYPTVIRTLQRSTPSHAQLFHTSDVTPWRTPAPEPCHPLNCDDHTWTDDISRYYLVEDLMKLNPAETLALAETVGPDHGCWHLGSRLTTAFGEAFFNNGETLGETLAQVLEDRGEDLHELHAAIASGKLGIVRGLARTAAAAAT